MIRPALGHVTKRYRAASSPNTLGGFHVLFPCMKD
jgi:hypothetical protein